MNAHLESLVKQIDENKTVPKGAPRTAKIGMSLAEQELLINKKLIEDVENGAQMPGQPGTIKRPFWKLLHKHALLFHIYLTKFYIYMY